MGTADDAAKVPLAAWMTHWAVRAFLTGLCLPHRVAAWAFCAELSDHRNSLAQIENRMVKTIGDIQHLAGLLDTLVAV